MERYENFICTAQRSPGRRFVPFVTSGDPALKQSLKIIDTFDWTLAPTPLELGVPFSILSPGRWPYHPE